MTPPDPQTQEGHLHAELAADIAAAAGGDPAVTLVSPHLEFHGASALDEDLTATHWTVDIAMYVDDDDDFEPRNVKVGFLEVWTVPIDGSLIYILDAISTDTAEYLKLVSAGEISDEVQEQFDSPCMTGLLILDRAYVHPALRGRDLGVWAVVNAIRHLTFGSIGVLVVAHPTPTEKRPGLTVAVGAKRLARYWSKAGLEPIAACPKLVGKTTAVNAIDNARLALSEVDQLSVDVDVRDFSSQ